MTKILTIVNLIGCAGAFIYLFWSMKITTQDNRHPFLVKVEWALLTTLALIVLTLLQVLLGGSIPFRIPDGFSHLSTWVMATLFAHYLRLNYK